MKIELKFKIIAFKDFDIEIQMSYIQKQSKKINLFYGIKFKEPQYLRIN